MHPRPRPRRVLALALSIGGALALTGCAAASAGGANPDSGATVTIAHAQGSTSVPLQPARIAVFDFGVLDTVDALGGSVVALPKKALPASLSRYSSSSYVDAGTLAEPDLEALAQARPDVILIGARAAAKHGELSKIAPTLDLSLTGTDVIAAGKKQAQQIGTLLDRSAQVDAAHAELDRAVAATAAKGAKAGTGLVLMTSGGKASAFGSGSRFGLIHDALKVKPAIGALTSDRHGQAIGFEAISKAAPQRIFVVDRDVAIGQSGSSAKHVLDNPLVATTPAAKQGKVTYLDGSRWYVMGSGLRNLPQMVSEVDRGLS